MPESISAFMEGFVKDEHELSLLFYLEPNQDLLENQYKKVAGYFLPGITTGLMNQYNIHRDEGWFERNEELSKHLIPRTIFKIEEYEDEDIGIIFRCQIGQNSNQIEDLPAYHFFVTRFENHLVTAAYYHACVFCSGSGTLKKQKCPECHYGLRISNQIGNMCEFFPAAAVKLHDQIFKFVKNRLRSIYEQEQS